MEKIVLSALISVLLLSPITQAEPIKPAAEILKKVPAPSPYDARNIRFVIQSTFAFSNRGTDAWYLTEEDRVISLFMNNTWQTVLLIHRSCPLETITKDDDGNSIAVLDFQRVLQPGESVSYSVSYNVLSKPRTIPDLNEDDSGRLEDMRENLRKKYCVSQPPWLVEDEEIREVAFGIAGNETRVLTIIERFIAWIWENIQYPSQRHEFPYYPNETLKKREGDCDDQAILFVTFCRVYGIPSFIQSGCVYLATHYANVTVWDGHISYELRRIGWHGWAIVYVPPWGWLPVDLTFVMGSLAYPLNAIKYGAVTFQEVVQYVNVSKEDYVASSRTYRDFLQQNDFYVHSMDEMTMTFLGDLNCDFIVNILDVAIVARAFGSKQGDPNWNAMADTAELYDVIDIGDVSIVVRDFGETI